MVMSNDEPRGNRRTINRSAAKTQQRGCKFRPRRPVAASSKMALSARRSRSKSGRPAAAAAAAREQRRSRRIACSGGVEDRATAERRAVEADWSSVRRDAAPHHISHSAGERELRTEHEPQQDQRDWRHRNLHISSRRPLADAGDNRPQRDRTSGGARTARWCGEPGCYVIDSPSAPQS